MCDVALAVSGTVLTLTAYFDFRAAHARAAERNEASGTLKEKATVTPSEMLEHAFYQILNLFQIVYLHVVSTEWFGRLGLAGRMACTVASTSIWLVRGAFPTNSFSKNYEKGVVDFESFLYRIKKWQYVLYKAVLLHGLNCSVVFADEVGRLLVRQFPFRCFWLCLNSAYVLEFFLQTLVKRKYMRQSTMLIFNQVLMVISTVAVIPVLAYIDPVTVAVTFALNFINRRREIPNVVSALFVGALRHKHI